MTQDSKALVLSPLFLTALCLLLINDFSLKATFHNEITGKLSDFAGLFIFPIFFCAFLPRAKAFIFVIVGGFFVFWKSSYAQPLLDLWNSLGLIPISRKVDPTDLLALSVLPLSYLYVKRRLAGSPADGYLFVKASVVLLSVFAFTATHFVNDRSVWVDHSYQIALTRTAFEDRLRSLETIREVSVEKMTDKWPKDQYPKLDMSPTGYYLRFKIRKGYCESTEVDFFSSFEDKASFVLIDGPISFRYWCPREPTKDDEVALAGIFEDEVIGHLPPAREND